MRTEDGVRAEGALIDAAVRGRRRAIAEHCDCCSWCCGRCGSLFSRRPPEWSTDGIRQR
jgi:hypothetical protein